MLVEAMVSSRQLINNLNLFIIFRIICLFSPFPTICLHIPILLTLNIVPKVFLFLSHLSFFSISSISSSASATSAMVIPLAIITSFICREIKFLNKSKQIKFKICEKYQNLIKYFNLNLLINGKRYSTI